jgi:hypothetical protein
MMREDPITYEELPAEHKQKYDEIKAPFEAGSWDVDRGTGAHQQSREPPGSSCCLSLLTGEF